jgi:hypothetical protein
MDKPTENNGGASNFTSSEPSTWPAPLVAPPATLTDFDFLVGAWRVKHHRLVGRLVGSTTWEDFEGECRLWPIIGGHGNVDDNVLHAPKGTYRAATLRLFDAERRTWSIYWLDSRALGIDTPMVGGFDGDRGFFYADEIQEGQAITCRFLWFVDDADHCRWEQAFTTDGGSTWETNWQMWLERTA